MEQPNKKIFHKNKSIKQQFKIQIQKQHKTQRPFSKNHPLKISQFESPNPRKKKFFSTTGQTQIQNSNFQTFTDPTQNWHPKFYLKEPKKKKTLQENQNQLITHTTMNPEKPLQGKRELTRRINHEATQKITRLESTVLLQQGRQTFGG